MIYSGIFRTIDMFSQFQARYSSITQKQFMLILSLIQADISKTGLFRRVMFHAYSDIFTKFYSWLHLWMNTCPYSGIFQQIEAYQDPYIAGLNSVNQHLLFKSGSSFKLLFKSVWNIFSLLFQKQIFNILLFRPKNHRHRQETFTSLCYMLFKNWNMYMDIIMDMTLYNSAYH